MKNILFISFITLAFVSCKKDKESPVIEIVSPDNAMTFSKGDTILLEANISDDIDLAKLHAHVGDENGNHTMDFMWEEELDLIGKTYHYNASIIIPETVEMVRYIHLEVTDAESKITEEKIMIHIME